MENNMEFPQKTENTVAIWSCSPAPGHVPRQNYNSKRHMHLCVHCSTVYKNQDMGATWLSIDRWVDKEDVVHIHNGILLIPKKEWSNAVGSDMDC